MSLSGKHKFFHQLNKVYKHVKLTILMQENDKKILEVLEYLSRLQNKKNENELIYQIQFNILHIEMEESKRIVNFLRKHNYIESRLDGNKIGISEEGKNHLKYLRQEQQNDKEYSIQKEKVQLNQRQLELQEKQTEILEQNMIFSRNLSRYTLYLVYATIVLSLGVLFQILHTMSGNIIEAFLVLIIVFVVIILWQLIAFFLREKT